MCRALNGYGAGKSSREGGMHCTGYERRAPLSFTATGRLVSGSVDAPTACGGAPQPLGGSLDPLADGSPWPWLWQPWFIVPERPATCAYAPRHRVSRFVSSAPVALYSSPAHGREPDGSLCPCADTIQPVAWLGTLCTRPACRLSTLHGRRNPRGVTPPRKRAEFCIK
jgi:hypothetical protein